MFYMIIDGLVGIFDALGTLFEGVSTAFYYAEYWANFIGWIADFIETLSWYFG